MRWLKEESDYYVRHEGAARVKAVPGGKTAKTAGGGYRKRNRAKEQLSDAQRQVRAEKQCSSISYYGMFG
jgi:hypothetical protein